MSHTLRCTILLLGFVPVALSPLPAAAQEYPAREIRSICNFAAGSGADILVRYYSDRLARLAGKPVLVENKVGAQGNIATEYVARAKPDGYTIMITPASSTLAAARHIFKQLSFDPVRDFTPVTTLAKLSFAIAVDAKRPIHSIAELTEYLKKKPGDGNYATGSNTGLVAAELYKEMAGLKSTHIPYKAAPNALSDLLGGEVDFMSYDVTFLMAQARAGRVRMLALTSATRLSMLPEVPTMAESGFPGYEIDLWFGLMAPGRTPQPVQARLNAEVNKALQAPELKEKLAAQFYEPLGGTPERFAAAIRSDMERYSKAIRDAGIKPE